jgi:hypothetical protein
VGLLLIAGALLGWIGTAGSSPGSQRGFAVQLTAVADTETGTSSQVTASFQILSGSQSPPTAICRLSSVGFAPILMVLHHIPRDASLPESATLTTNAVATLGSSGGHTKVSGDQVSIGCK